MNKVQNNTLEGQAEFFGGQAKLGVALPERASAFKS